MPDILQCPRIRSLLSLPGREWPAVARRTSVKVLIGLFAIAGVAGCVSAGPYNPSHLPPNQLSQVQELCGSVMGIPAGIGLSSDCVEGLSSSAVAISQARTLQEARRGCLGQGLASGRPGLSECELTTVSPPTAAASSDRADVRVDTSGLQRPAKSYFNASFDEVHRREQTACARLGYDPINVNFARCVARLDSALFASTHPMQ
jgi:hypothetical protein